jgi:hypothetical protein
VVAGEVNGLIIGLEKKFPLGNINFLLYNDIMKKLWSVDTIQDAISLAKHFKGKKVRNKTQFEFPNNEYAYLFTHVTMALDPFNLTIENCYSKQNKVFLTFTKNALELFLKD